MIDCYTKSIVSFLDNTSTNLLYSYLSNRSFHVTYDEAISEQKPIYTRVPMGSVLGPHIYLLYTADISETVNSATFAGYTALISSHSTYESAIANLQVTTDTVCRWTGKWRLMRPRQCKWTPHLDLTVIHQHSLTELPFLSPPRLDTWKFTWMLSSTDKWT